MIWTKVFERTSIMVGWWFGMVCTLCTAQVGHPFSKASISQSSLYSIHHMHMRICPCAMLSAKKGQQKVPTFKKTTGLCRSRRYYSMNWAHEGTFTGDWPLSSENMWSFLLNLRFNLIKGSVSWDFWPSFFFKIRTHLGPWETGWNIFEFSFDFTEIFKFLKSSAACIPP